MLGAALILPMFLELVLSLGQRYARAPLSVWFWADSRQQLSGLSLALMALLLALSVNVGVSTMVESFSRTFLVWLDGRLAADVYVNAANDNQAHEIKAWLRERPEVAAILPGARADTQLAGAPIEVLGLPDHATYRDNWPLLQSAENVWIKLRPGNAALVSEQLARRLHLSVGDRIEVPATGGNWTLDVVGIYADYGNPKGQIAVNYAALTRRFPEVPLTRMGLRVAPPKIPALIAALQEKFALDNRNVADQATMKAESTRIFNRTFAVTAALNAFTLGVAGVALLTSLLSTGQFPPAATRAAMGDRHHTAAARGHRTSQDDVGGADHHHLRASARPARRVVPARGRQRQGVRLAVAVSRLPGATAVARRRRDGGGAGRGRASRHPAGAHAAGEPDQDFCQ